MWIPCIQLSIPGLFLSKLAPQSLKLQLEITSIKKPVMNIFCYLRLSAPGPEHAHIKKRHGASFDSFALKRRKDGNIEFPAAGNRKKGIPPKRYMVLHQEMLNDFITGCTLSASVCFWCGKHTHKYFELLNFSSEAPGFSFKGRSYIESSNVISGCALTLLLHMDDLLI